MLFLLYLMKYPLDCYLLQRYYLSLQNQAILGQVPYKGFRP